MRSKGLVTVLLATLLLVACPSESTPPIIDKIDNLVHIEDGTVESVKHTQTVLGHPRTIFTVNEEGVLYFVAFPYHNQKIKKGLWIELVYNKEQTIIISHQEVIGEKGFKVIEEIMWKAVTKYKILGNTKDFK